MASITITLSNGESAQINLPNLDDTTISSFIDDIAEEHNYTRQTKSQNNPPSKLQFVASKTTEYWGALVRAYRSRDAAKQARQSANEAIDSLVDGWDVT